MQDPQAAQTRERQEGVPGMPVIGHLQRFVVDFNPHVTSCAQSVHQQGLESDCCTREDMAEGHPNSPRIVQRQDLLKGLR